MAGFSGFDPVIRRFGGIASRRELLDAGWSETDLWFALSYGNLSRIRRGWFAASDLSDDARRAWRAGGPLACVSALLHHGLLDAAPSDDALGLHICLPSDGHLPASDGSLPTDEQPSLVVHWSTTDRRSGTRRAVAPAVALRQARACSNGTRARVAEVPLVRVRRVSADGRRPGE